MNTDSLGIRLDQLRLTGSTVSGKTYGVSFESEGNRRPLSVIAGESQTGKTSTIEFILYCLAGKTHPQHSEIAEKVRSSILQTELASSPTTIERSATGTSSSFASVWESGIDELAGAEEARLAVEPTSDPSGLSQYLLRACGLDGVALPMAPTQEESEVQALSIRDVIRLMWLPNERLDNKNLLYESHYVNERKFLQTVDVMFGVDNAAGVAAAANLRLARQDLREAEGVARSLRSLVSSEYPTGPLALESDRDAAASEVEGLTLELRRIDRDRSSHESHLGSLRERLNSAQSSAQSAHLQVNNRRGLLDRLSALRAQYVDDHRKLAFLTEAERLFDPLQLVKCPACMSELAEAPYIRDGACSLCGANPEKSEFLLTEVDGNSGASSLGVLQAELRATNRRLRELTEYWGRLDRELNELRSDADKRDDELEAAAQAVDDIVELPAPFLATRDATNARISQARLDRQKAETGLRLWTSVAAAEDRVERLEGRVGRLRAESSEARQRPARDVVISKLSRRFGDILADIDYPKLSQPFLDNALVPHVRGLNYRSASSGGLVLISLAWYLSFWEVAFEEGAKAPGLLIIDSPQKNLGHSADDSDGEFGDAKLVDNFYRHAKDWLAGPGTGAQLVVVDNTPPSLVNDDVVVRFTRDRSRPPYGLIDDATV